MADTLVQNLVHSIPKEALLAYPFDEENWFYRLWRDALDGWPLQVVYRGRGKACFIKRDTFAWLGEDDGPSACEWIVPGTWKREYHL